MSKILAFFLQLETQIKLYHWQTTSHPRHVASDSLHKEITGIMDTFMEVYIGKYGRTCLQNPRSIKLMNVTDAQAENVVKAAIAFLLDELPTLLNPTKDTDLLNMRDELVAKLNQTLYLFTLK